MSVLVPEEVEKAVGHWQIANFSRAKGRKNIRNESVLFYHGVYWFFRTNYHG